jgi:hypothetical protein
MDEHDDDLSSEVTEGEEIETDAFVSDEAEDESQDEGEGEGQEEDEDS